MNFNLKQVSSLQRIFLDGNIDLTQISCATALKGERFSYQLAYSSEFKVFVKLAVESELAEYITIRQVGNVPSEQPCRDEAYEYYERYEAGLFPDVLFPIDTNNCMLKSRAWYSFWVTVNLPEDVKAGEYDIKICITNDEELLGEKTLKLTVLDAVLPEQELIYTEWFHCDGIANYYNAPAFSERFWKLCESFMRAARRVGVNMLFTPVFTPPLDTQIGGERLTIQLVDVTVTDNGYVFGFDKLRRWIKMGKACGMKYYEISHMFTQWGAFAAPKVIAKVGGEEKRIFGWETVATSDEYVGFLRAFLPELINVLSEEGIDKVTYFHISDEPNENQIANYLAAKEAVADLLTDFPIFDALSDYTYYENGYIENPIPSTGATPYFLERGYKNHWTYYCCGPIGSYSNRIFAMPLSATRIFGLQLYKYDITGFLHWGLNFYNSQHSLRSINPFEVTDADGEFSSGDAFIVYPGEDGAVDSVRGEVFNDAIQDMRAMKLAGEIIGKDKLIAKLEDEFGEIRFDDFPRGTSNMLAIRERINSIIAKK